MPVKAPRYSHAVPGLWNVRCDRCGAKRKSDEVIYDAYYGLWVCPQHFDGQHPIDRHEAKPDDIKVPFAQPTPADRFDDTDVDGGDVGIPESTYTANGGGAGSVATGTFADQTGTGTISIHTE